MLLAASALIERAQPSESEVQDALGGVLCRCTGYRKIIAAVLDAYRRAEARRCSRPTGVGGARCRGSTASPRSTAASASAPTWLRPTRSGCGDPLAARARHVRHRRPRAAVPQVSRLAAVLTAADIPGVNRFRHLPPFADQPVLAEGRVRFRGEPVALVGDARTIEAFDRRLPGRLAAAAGARRSTSRAPRARRCCSMTGRTTCWSGLRPPRRSRRR